MQETKPLFCDGGHQFRHSKQLLPDNIRFDSEEELESVRERIIDLEYPVMR